ncbi:MAG: hypothetical protein H7255_10145 [Ramlibacter sp.]|nr:hypothetical protein [Ramlibacter sp.]
MRVMRLVVAVMMMVMVMMLLSVMPVLMFLALQMVRTFGSTGCLRKGDCREGGQQRSDE